MTQLLHWQDGLDQYRSHTISLDHNTINYNCTLQYHSRNQTHFQSALQDILGSPDRPTIELLFSGGLDSEFVLTMLLARGYSVTAVTMKLCCRGYAVNTHDLYYSEKFCRDRQIRQRFLELDIEQFFESGRYLDYLIKYHIQEPHVATHFWMFEQCDNFPVLAGEYSWPWVSKPLLSPHRLEYSCYDRFMHDRGITGIGNLLNHSYDINAVMIAAHHDIMSRHQHDAGARNLPVFKKSLYDHVSGQNFEIRMRSSGWENLPRSVFNKSAYRLELIRQMGRIAKSSITWPQQLNVILGGEVQHNDRYS